MSKREVFSPLKITREEVRSDQAAWLAYTDSLKVMNLDELRAENARLFSLQIFGMTTVTAKVWLLNLEFTRRGIAPRWRGAPEHTDQAAPETAVLNLPGIPNPLTETARRRKVLRWIDLEWLRDALGQAHPIMRLGWSSAFVADDPEPIWRGIVEEQSANAITLDELSVPKLHRLALLGFQTSPARDRFRTLDKFLSGPVGRLLAAQATRRKYPLTPSQVDDRIRDIRAIELAEGSATDAAMVRRWMTGELVTRQAMSLRRQKIASQVPALTRRTAWK